MTTVGLQCLYYSVPEGTSVPRGTDGTDGSTDTVLFNEMREKHITTGRGARLLCEDCGTPTCREFLFLLSFLHGVISRAIHIHYLYRGATEGSSDHVIVNYSGV